jgi:hypothetical protein
VITVVGLENPTSINYLSIHYTSKLDSSKLAQRAKGIVFPILSIQEITTKGNSSKTSL